ncbi:carboxypeptidase regulatory-like domain-containing protein [uncultured Paludibaculum sp.]|uniref:TonB-dependent receptor n=1 Tax=uncultured Paludibaculum sp. TaxID=1765020 RepID=UPI002AABE7C6|nr:carboxypeptidase regulatory-like domain-containing protein [uncultured Paludibaculum sp.]
MPLRFRICAAACLLVTSLAAAEHRGHVTFRGLPVPGATVTASRDGKSVAAVTDQQGVYSFADLADGPWSVQVTMFGFEPMRQDVTVGAQAPAAEWALTLLTLDRIKAEIQVTAPPEHPAAPPRPAAILSKEAHKAVAAAQPAPDDDMSQRAADGLLINGSVNNGASSAFGQAAAFGNNRFGGKGLYNGGIGLMLGNSVFDARPYSLTGQNTPKAAYNRLTGMVNFGGPLKIPHLLKNGPFVFFGYQWTRNNDATTSTALVPSLAERSGVFPGTVVDPLSGVAFPGNAIPQSRISPQAQSLLNYYPLPNFGGTGGYNYQTPLLSPTHQDALQTRASKPVGRNNQLFGQFSFQSARMDSPNLFHFQDKTGTQGINTGVNWMHRFNQRLFITLGAQFSRMSTRVTPYFANRVDVSGEAGIVGNNRDPLNWGPPTLNFSSGIAGLSDAQSSFNRSQTSGLSVSMLWTRGNHSFAYGGDYRRQLFHYLSQQDPRGTFTFTGAETGSDFGDFLLGTPRTSSIAFGNADKYFRQSVYDAFFTDDWHINQAFTLNAGIRWDYNGPITEASDRLVNLDISPGFAAAAPVLASNPTGALTGQQYPSSLIRPFKPGFSPRAGIAWRPRAGSSLVVRGGYGIYYDTSIYQALATRLAQQPPLSTTASVQRSAADPITLADGFRSAAAGSSNTIAIDPNFRPGYAQNWQVSLQSDLPGALQMTATYAGIKGTHAMQALLPNTFPVGAANPCPSCPSGFAYLLSSGNSSRESAQVQLRRRLRSGFTATLQYVFSKSIDNAAALGGGSSSQGGANQNSGGAQQAAPLAGLGGLAIAQNWLDTGAERSLSSFDQRHLLTLQMQYTTGMGLMGGTLLNGWKGAVFKEWSMATQVTAGSGLPQTPVYLAAVEGTGITGTIRPDYTGVPQYDVAPGRFVNSAAYAAPQSGQWGTAGRNTITGPSQFTLNASMSRTFRVTDRLNLDLRLDSVNLLNRVNYSVWNTTVNGAQFGLPASANAMRSVQTTLRLRF